jgi:pimeloyl-ACP methyl ester carboxylesterase
LYLQRKIIVGNLEIIGTKPEHTSKGVIVFVHGACHAAWCWENFQQFFGGNGYETLAISLPGHGKSVSEKRLNDIRLDDYVNAVRQVINKYPAVFLVGHSMGGGVVQKLINEDVGRVKAAVLISTAPPNKSNKTTVAVLKLILSNDPRGKAFMKVASMMSTKIATDPETVRTSAFFSGRITKEAAEKYISLLQLESKKALNDVAKLKIDCSTVNIPVFVITSKNDDCVILEQQKRIAHEYNREAIILDDLCHDMMLDPDWEISAKAVLDCIKGIR